MPDMKRYRNDFPMIRNHPELIYFDNSATTYKPQCVIDAVTSFYTDFTSNIERGDYETAIKADKAYDHGREVISRLLNCSEKEVAFTTNITASLNQIAYGLGSSCLKQGDTVLLSQAEHASNLLPWFRLQQQKGIRIAYLPLDEQGNIRLDKLEAMLDETVKVISLAYVTNVLGSVQPIREICAIAHRHGILVVVDAAQAVGHRKIDFRELDADFLCFSSHKMCGPDGVGVLVGRYELLQQMEPIFLGGGMNARFEADGSVILKDAPVKFEAGTPNIEGVIGLSAAAQYLMDIGLDEIHAYEIELRAYLMEKMKELEHVKIYNPDNQSGPLTFNIEDVFAQDAAGYLAAHHIAVRSGNHCAKILHHIIGTDQSVRASLYFYNTKEEIDRFADTVRQINIRSVIDIII